MTRKSYGTVTEFCTPQECPMMCAGPRFEYHWQDGVHYKKPTKFSAPGTDHSSSFVGL
jgi:MOB kinase activator 1